MKLINCGFISFKIIQYPLAPPPFMFKSVKMPILVCPTACFATPIEIENDILCIQVLDTSGQLIQIAKRVKGMRIFV